MRLAVVSTPRSGNSWVRCVLRDIYQLTEIAVHNPKDIPDSLPSDTVLQIHWYREPNFQALLAREGFRVLVLARHPLDVLLSVLHFVRHEPATARWLEGNAELPVSLGRTHPTSDTFLDYALSWGAENLLGVSYAWWHDASALRVHYEDLVRDPGREFGQLIRALGEPQRALEDALHVSRLEAFQATPNRHGWQGRPGIWKLLIPPATAFRIYRRHRSVFRLLGYGFSPYVLSERTAQANWERLAASEMSAGQR